MQVANKLLKCWMYSKTKKEVWKEKQTKDGGEKKTKLKQQQQKQSQNFSDV